jgi:hypothetical protein
MWYLSLTLIVRSKEAHTVFDSSYNGDVGSNPIRNMNVYLCRIAPNAVHITTISFTVTAATYHLVRGGDLIRKSSSSGSGSGSGGGGGGGSSNYKQCSPVSSKQFMI